MAWVRVGSWVVDMPASGSGLEWVRAGLCRLFIGDAPSGLSQGSEAPSQTVSLRLLLCLCLCWAVLCCARARMHGASGFLLRLCMCNKARFFIPPRRSFCFLHAQTNKLKETIRRRPFVFFISASTPTCGCIPCSPVVCVHIHVAQTKRRKRRSRVCLQPLGSSFWSSTFPIKNTHAQLNGKNLRRFWWRTRQ